MPSELFVRAVHQGQMQVSASARNHTVTMDYPLNGNQTTAGPTPLEMLLASLAACSANSLSLLLQRQGQPVQGITVEARGQRRDEHPTVLTSIELSFELKGPGMDEEVVKRALVHAEEKICPVWAMLKAGTPISTNLKIVS